MSDDGITETIAKKMESEAERLRGLSDAARHRGEDELAASFDIQADGFVQAAAIIRERGLD